MYDQVWNKWGRRAPSMQITSHLQTVPAGMSPVNDNLLIRKWRNWNCHAKLWETVWQLLSWWSELPCNPAPLFSGTCQGELKAFIHIKTFTNVHSSTIHNSKAVAEKIRSPLKRKKGRGCCSVLGCLPYNFHCIWSLTPPEIHIYGWILTSIDWKEVLIERS